MASLVLCFVWAWPLTADCLQASFVEKSWRWVRQAHISSNLDDQGVICLLDGWLFCQKTVAIYHYSPHIILIDSSTEITSLELSVSSVILCWAKRRFKVHFFLDNKLKFAYFWLAINFIYFLSTCMWFFFQKSYFHDSVPLICTWDAVDMISGHLVVTVDSIFMLIICYKQCLNDPSPTWGRIITTCGLITCLANLQLGVTV